MNMDEAIRELRSELPDAEDGYGVLPVEAVRVVLDAVEFGTWVYPYATEENPTSGYRYWRGRVQDATR